MLCHALCSGVSDDGSRPDTQAAKELLKEEKERAAKLEVCARDHCSQGCVVSCPSDRLLLPRRSLLRQHHKRRRQARRHIREKRKSRLLD